MEALCKIYLRTEEDVPKTEDLLAAGDPEQTAQLYRDAGLNVLANSASAIMKAVVATKDDAEMTRRELDYYLRRLPRHVAPADFRQIPPVSVAALLKNVRESGKFNTLTLLSDPRSNETLLYGTVDSELGMRFFKLAHWGSKLHTPPRWQLPRINPQSLFVGVAGLLSAAVAWGSWVLLGSWWLFLPILIGGMAIYYFTMCNTLKKNTLLRMLASVFALANVIVGVVPGAIYAGIHYSSTPHVSRVQVCSAYYDDYDEFWGIRTSVGTMTVKPGWYNHTYYDTPKKAAKGLAGHEVDLTWYNQLMGYPHATSGQFVGAGNCGK